jgi:hypothetical protein
VDPAPKLLIVTGAGASRNLGSGSPLPLMPDWNRIVIEALDKTELMLSMAVGLRPSMGGAEFEDQVGQILEWSRLLKLFEQFGRLGADPLGGKLQTGVEDWVRHNDSRVRAFIRVLNRTLFERFGADAIDDAKAKTAYEWVDDDLLPNVPTSLILATTNYDQSAEIAFQAMGYAVHDGFTDDAVRTPRYDPTNLGNFAPPSTKQISVLHLHGGVGWYEREQGVRRYSADIELNEAFGVPLVLHPDPKKHPDSLPQIRRIWDEFRAAVRAATHILVIGHSLNDPTLVDYLRDATGQVVVAGLRPHPSMIRGAVGRYCSFGPGNPGGMSWVRAWLIQGNSALPTFEDIPETLGPRASKTSVVANYEDQEVLRVDFHQIRRALINVYPRFDSGYWRLGLSFGTTPNLPTARVSAGHPLWHLTKPDAGTTLYVDYYDQFGKAAVSRAALDDYHGEPVTVELSANASSLELKVHGSPGYVQRLGLTDHAYARILAWADKRSYSLDVVVEELTNPTQSPPVPQR